VTSVLRCVDQVCNTRWSTVFAANSFERFAQHSIEGREWMDRTASARRWRWNIVCAFPATHS